MSNPDAKPAASAPAEKLKSNCPPGSFDALIEAYLEGLNAAALANEAAMAKDAERRAAANREVPPKHNGGVALNSGPQLEPGGSE